MDDFGRWLPAWPWLEAATAWEAEGRNLRIATPGGVYRLVLRAASRMPLEVSVLGRIAVPAPVPVETADGSSFAVAADEAALVYRELPGHPVVDLSAAAARRLGLACAWLQDALLAVPCDEPDLPRRPEGVVAGPVQVIHRDFHAGNVLVEDGEVSGFLDFDHVEWGPRLVDPCYAAGCRLADLMSDGVLDPVPPWLESWLGIIGGYAEGLASRGRPLTFAEADATVATMIEIQHDFASWFRWLGDEHNERLTHSMIELISRIADPVRAIARQIAMSS